MLILSEFRIQLVLNLPLLPQYLQQANQREQGWSVRNEQANQQDPKIQLVHECTALGCACDRALCQASPGFYAWKNGMSSGVAWHLKTVCVCIMYIHLLSRWSVGSDVVKGSWFRSVVVHSVQLVCSSTPGRWIVWSFSIPRAILTMKTYYYILKNWTVSFHLWNLANLKLVIFIQNRFSGCSEMTF